MLLKRIPLLLFILSLLLVGAGLISYYYSLSQYDPSKQTHRIQSFVLEREEELRDLDQQIRSEACAGFSDYKSFPKSWKRLSDDRNISIYKYTKGELLVWTDNAVPVDLGTLIHESPSRLWKLNNGWYLARRIEGKGCSLLAIALIKRNYSYQNDYLLNEYPGINNVPTESSFQQDKGDGAKQILDSKGQLISWFVPAVGAISNQNGGIAPLWLIIIGIILLLFSGHVVIFEQPLNRQKLLIPIWLILLISVRWFSFEFKWPAPLYNSHLFSPIEYAASNWLPTLGDLLLNSLLLLYFALLIHQVEFKIPKLSSSGKLIAGSFLSGVLFLTGCSIGDLTKGLIINSSISLDINDFLSLRSSSFVAFLIIGALFAILFFAVDKAAGWFKLAGIKPIQTVPGIALGLIVQINQIASDGWMIAGVILILLWVILVRNRKTGYTYAGIIGLIGLFAFWGTIIILQSTGNKELEKRKLLAGKIAAERDPIAESLFLETENKILSDTLLKNYLRPLTVSSGQVRDLAQLYYNGYWEKYNISVNVFGADECPMTRLYTTSISDPLIFDRLIDSIGIPTLSDHFFFLDNGSGKISYLAKLQIRELETDSVPLGTLFVEFNSRYTPEEIGYPELLLDKMVSTNTDLSNYSYARYTNGKLVSHFGSVPYGLSDNLFRGIGNQHFSLMVVDGISHLVHVPRSGSLIVLSLPERGILGVLTPFSYLMFFFGLFALVLSIRKEWWRNQSGKNLSFKRRIQFSIIFILFLSLLLIGGGTILYIVSNSNQKNNKNISEKIHSILVETEYLIEKDASLNPFRTDEIAYSLTKLANVFFADINIFDPFGQLYASSRPKIFEEGLVAKRMNPDAYFHLKTEYATEYVHQENIGLLNYLSAYVPLRNAENTVIGYLNLPYFAKQNELSREISTFVIAIINIYVLLIVFVVIAAIFLSNSVTEPLRLIQERLSNIQLGRKNEMIAWKGNDEIGNLIHEYNRMVSELAESAEKLAQSERESAWREMAKQVAHEIKNPLTPMKLSTQLLKRAWDDKAPEFDKRLERYTQNLIEQIDALSHIANAFSNFAKMPHAINEEVEVSELIQSALDFHKSEEQVELSFVQQCPSPCNVLADREQLLRVFNNLIRNAIQAISDERNGKIEIKLYKKDAFYEIEISDNGVGIPEELRSKIFNPNFTTKTTGMGLGLALVKNTLEHFNGKVRFESEPGIGCTFFVSLPIKRT